MRDLLQSVPIFAGLSSEALDFLITEGAELTFADGDIIFREGEIDEAAYLIETGQVSISQKRGLAGETELIVLNASEFFGETCLIEMIAHTATARALGPTTL
eukprot:gene2860-biopygen2400